MSWTHRTARRAAGVFLVVGLIALGYVAYVVADAQVYQAIEQRRFERARAEAVAAPALIDGGPIGEIRIPRLGLQAIVVQGDSASILQRAVGHIADTALPGQVGNVVLAGHRDTFFRPLKHVRIGDAIALRTREGDFQYRVESTAVVPPSDVQVLQPTGGRTLTLITCFPFSYLGSAPDRFIVRARATEGHSTIRRAVAPPSSDFTTYIEGELIRVSIPSNWRELPGSNAVTFAPEGAYGNAGVKSVFTHGVGMGLARNDKHNLSVTTDDFIASSVLVNPRSVSETRGHAPGPIPLPQGDDRRSAWPPHRGVDDLRGHRRARADRDLHDAVARRHAVLLPGGHTSRPRGGLRTHVPTRRAVDRDHGLRGMRALVNRQVRAAMAS